MANNEIKISVVFAKAGANKNVKEFTGSLREMEQTTKSTGAAAGKSFEKTKNSALKNFGKAGLVGIAAGASGAVVLGYNRMIDKGSEFQQNLADLSAITGIQGKALDSLGDRSLKTSVKYGESASNIITANKLVASQLAEKIDFGTDEGLKQLQDISEQAIILQKAAGVELSTAVNTLTTAVNQFNLPASETNRLINSIAAGSKFGAAEVAEQSAAYAEAGSVAASTNQSFEVLNATTQILAANAIKGSKAGVGIRNVLLTLNNSAKLAENGVEGVDLQADGLAVTLGKLNPLLSDSAKLEKLFGRESITASQILIKNADSVATMTEKVTGSNVALEQAEIQMNTYQGAQARLASAIDAQLIPAFQENNGVMVKGINTLIDYVEATGYAVSVINDWFDSYSGLREKIEQNNEVIRAQVSVLNDEKKALQERLETVEKGSVEEEALYENLENVSAALVRKKRELEKDKKQISDNVKTQKEYIENLKKEETGLFASTQKVVDAEKKLATLKIQYQGAEEALLIYDQALQKNTQSQANNKDANEENDEVIGGLSKRYKENENRINELINSTESLTQKEWDELASKTAKNKAIEEEVKKRKELAEFMANDGLKVDAQKPEDTIIEPDFEPLPSFEMNTDPILVASEAIQKLEEDVANYINTSAVLGNHTNDINFALQRTEATISSLIENGYSATGPAIQKLVEDYDKLKQAQQAQAAFMQAATNDQISSLRDLGNEVRAQVLAAIKARIAEAVATQIAKALKTVPFPLNVAVAAAAGAAVPLLFNQLPSFEKGVDNFAGGLAKVHKNEIITYLPKGSNVITNKNVEAMDKMQGQQFIPHGNSPSVMVQPSDNSDILKAIQEQTDRFELIERRVEFNMTEFNAKYNKWLKKEAALT